MRQELQNIEYIERYLENKLSNEDKYKFEQHLKNDVDFRNAVELQRQIVEQLKESAFLADIAAFHKEYISEPTKPPTRHWGLLSLAVLVFSTLSIGLWWYSNSDTTNSISSNSTNKIETVVEKENYNTENSESLAVQLKAFEKQFITKKVQAKNGASIQLANGTVLHIPAGAIVDKNGNPVTGSFDLQYRELKDKAEMAFAGIPMNYKNDNVDYGFNSAGMLELRAFKNGEELQVASGKSLSLDYEVSKKMPNLNFYRYDNQQNNWVSIADNLKFPKKGAYTESLDSVAYQAALAERDARVKALDKKNEVKQDGKNLDLGPFYVKPEGIEKVEIPSPDPNKYLVKHFENPQLVKGLELPSFGVYNCSQIYQTQNQIAIAATYTTAQKKIIKNARLLSIIDMNYNAAYSFQPDNFICNGKANNVFLLWSNDGKLYGFVKRASVKLGTGSYSFVMEDLSNSIHNTNDLKRYLKFVEKAI